MCCHICIPIEVLEFGVVLLRGPSGSQPIHQLICIARMGCNLMNVPAALIQRRERVLCSEAGITKFPRGRDQPVDQVRAIFVQLLHFSSNNARTLSTRPSPVSTIWTWMPCGFSSPAA